MEFTITVSEEVEEQIISKANAKGEKPEEFLRELVEAELARTSGNIVESEKTTRRNNLMELAGMFSSGITDTSERMSEIMRNTEFDSAEGFSSGIKAK